MFTGIIENTGIIQSIIENGGNKTFRISSPLAPSLKVDQSLSHNGVCLTIEKIENNDYEVTAIPETLKKTALSYWKPGDLINLERSMLMNGRLDGHIVQGHVDDTAICIDTRENNGSFEFTFQINEEHSPLIIEKGSICINGISLTLFDVKENRFSVGIIPYTFNHTNILQLKTGDKVNIEFDVLGKYVQKMMPKI